MSILKGRLNLSSSDQWLRKGLVIFQFALSLIYTVSVLVINKQMQYTQTKNLGYSRDHIISFYGDMEQEGTTVFLSRLKDLPGVGHASYMTQSMQSGGDAQRGYNWKGDASDEAYLFKSPQIGYDLIETLDMDIVAGRSFSNILNGG